MFACTISYYVKPAFLQETEFLGNLLHERGIVEITVLHAEAIVTLDNLNIPLKPLSMP